MVGLVFAGYESARTACVVIAAFPRSTAFLHLNHSLAEVTLGPSA